MSLLVDCAQALGTPGLIDITQSHVVGSYYCGPADLKLLHKLVNMDARVRVPTTLIL